MRIKLMESFQNYFLYNQTPVLFFCKSVIKIILAPSPVACLYFQNRRKLAERQLLPMEARLQKESPSIMLITDLQKKELEFDYIKSNF